MHKRVYTRRGILTSIALGIIALAVCSCLSIADKTSKTTFTFAQLCDPQLGYGGYEADMKRFEQAVEQINDLKPDFVVICGDLVAKANEDSFADFNKIKAKLTVPAYCVPGNHDFPKQITAESLEFYRKLIGEDYYSFEHKGHVFVMVNTQLWKTRLAGESEKHDTWFNKTLATTTKKKARIFVVGHHPLFIEEPGEDETHFNLPVTKRETLLDLFETNGVVAVVTGHTHRPIINTHEGIQLVSGEASSRCKDKAFGFRMWHIGEARPFKHEFIALQRSRKKATMDTEQNESSVRQ